MSLEQTQGVSPKEEGPCQIQLKTCLAIFFPEIRLTCCQGPVGARTFPRRSGMSLRTPPPARPSPGRRDPSAEPLQVPGGPQPSRGPPTAQGHSPPAGLRNAASARDSSRKGRALLDEARRKRKSGRKLGLWERSYFTWKMNVLSGLIARGRVAGMSG